MAMIMAIVKKDQRTIFQNSFRKESDRKALEEIVMEAVM